MRAPPRPRSVSSLNGPAGRIASETFAQALTTPVPTAIVQHEGHMRLYVFSSRSLTNIWAGVGAGMWAISEKQAENVSGAVQKASAMRIGSAGIIYCSETQAFTTPFLVLSSPVPDQTVSNVWPEPWTLPFRIHPLGTPRRQLHKDRLDTDLPSLRDRARQWNHVLLVTPVTVFVPSEIDEGDWEVLVTQLGES